ncbi:RNA-directed DNA polymerase, eukaryota, reverse transcriptase zinc-binding domain protein [Tanacetum coccineum]
MVNPPMKKSIKSLKPMKTTRTMNPKSKNTMKHDEMIGKSSDINFKKINTRSRSKGGDAIMVNEEMDCWEDTSNVSIGKEGLVNFVGQRDGINEDMSIHLGVNGNSGSASVKMVSNPFFESNSSYPMSVNDCLDKNSGISLKGGDVMSEISVLVSENPILNPDFASNSKPKSVSRVSFGEVRRPGMFKVNGVDLFKGVELVSNYKVGEDSKINDANMGDNGSVKKPFLFMSALTGGSVSSDNKLKFVSGSVNNEGREVTETDPMLENGSTKWNMTVIGHFVGYQMSYREIMGNLRRMWRPYEFDDIIMNNSGLYFCKFKSHDGMQTVIKNGPWIATVICEKLYGRASFARVLVEVNSVKGLVDEVEVWYRSLNKSMILNVEYAWRPPICKHCRVFGHTLKSCQSKNLSEEEKRIKESMKPVNVPVVDSDRNERRDNGVNKQYVLVRGNVKNVSNEKKGMKEDKKDLGKRGNNVANEVDSVNENGFSMLNDDEGSKELIEWREFCTRIDVACKIGITIDEAEKLTWSEKMMDYFLAKLKNNIDKVLTPEEVLKNKMDSLQKQIVEGNKGLRKNAKRVAEQRIIDECAGKKVQLVYNNFYSQAYEKELKKVKGLKWERDMLEVELFVCSNQPLANNIKEFWSDDMVEYFEQVNEEKESDKINGHWCDVDEGSNATASFMAHDDVSNLHDESMAEMQENDVKSLIRDERINMIAIIETQVRKKFVNPVCNDLFRSWSWVSNVVDSRKGCRILVKIEDCYGRIWWIIWILLVALLGLFLVTLTFLLVLKNVLIALKRGMEDFRDCKQNLEVEDLNSYGMFYTWIEKRKNPKLGILKKLDKVMGNRDFVHNFGGSYANLLPYLASDHCPALFVLPDVQTSKPKSFRFMIFLVKKDNFLSTVRQKWNVEVKGFSMFVLVKRLKNMKKYMRKLNKDNGNVFEKAKFLKTKLKRVKLCLDKDPHNALLREEELIYSKAYHDVAVEEERLMKQKSKIEWLREGDHNSAYFYRVLKGRVSKSRIEVVKDDSSNTYYGEDVALQFVDHFKKFLGTKEDVFTIEDYDGLFVKKLDPIIATTMIRPILDEEIKDAMFGIKDDKVAGPDGFTSKFFKKAWSIIGPDMCRAVREFFTYQKLLGELNANLISMVLKIKIPLRLSNYRPIAYCNVVYKCISKVLTNRLKEGLNGLVDIN